MRLERSIRRAVPLRSRMGCVNLHRIAHRPQPSYAGAMNAALDTLEQALDALESAVDRLEAQAGSGTDHKLRAEVAEVIAELDAMLGKNRG
jgi:hypothetical protein